MKKKRIKAQPLQTAEEFLNILSELLALEATKRGHEADRDLALQRVNDTWAGMIAPVLDSIRAKTALAEAYAKAHRAELLPPKAKSVVKGLARVGWREGNREVELKSGVTVENAVNALKALSLGAYVATKETVAKAKILADCKDGLSLIANVPLRGGAGFVTKSVPLDSAGIRITQGESFYIEPASDAADTLKADTAAA